MSATAPRLRTRPHAPYSVPQTIESTAPAALPRTRTPESVRAFIRYGRRRRAFAALQDLAKLAGLVLAGVAIPLLAWAAIWIGFLLFKA